MKRIPHPSGADIIFDPKWHQYKLGSTALRSVSKLLDKHFPFDEKRILQLVSRKTGEPVDVIKRNWSRQALLGKNIHEYIECQLLKKPPPAFMLLLENREKRAAVRPADATGPSPSSSTVSSLEDEVLHGEEALYIPAAATAVHTIKSAYDVVSVEQVVAVPEWGLAGTIDFIGRNKANNRILIGDWKTSGSTVSSFRFGSFEVPCVGVLRHLPNSKFYRYAMQVCVYGEMLKRERYFEKGYFSAALKALAAGAQSGSAEEAAPPSKSRRGRPRKEQSKGNASVAPTVDWKYYLDGIEGKLEYGVVLISKDDHGMPVVEYKEVTERTVLPPDVPEATFQALLQDVMAGN